MCCALILVRTIAKVIVRTSVHIHVREDVVTIAILRVSEVVRAGVTHHVLDPVQVAVQVQQKGIVMPAKVNV